MLTFDVTDCNDPALWLRLSTGATDYVGRAWTVEASIDRIEAP